MTTPHIYIFARMNTVRSILERITQDDNWMDNPAHLTDIDHAHYNAEEVLYSLKRLRTHFVELRNTQEAG